MNDAIMLRIENRASIDRMSDDEAGALLKALLAHADGEEVNDEDLPAKASVLYPLIANQIDRANEKYEAVCRRRSAAAARREEQKRQERTDTTIVQTVPQTDKENTIADNPNPNPNPNKREDTSCLREKPAKARFVPPTVEEVQAYVLEKGYHVDAERFVDFYQAKNWMIGKNKMVDWKAAVRNWAKEHKDQKPPNITQVSPKRNPKIQAAYGFSTERSPDDVDYNRLAWEKMWQEG